MLGGSGRTHGQEAQTWQAATLDSAHERPEPLALVANHNQQVYGLVPSTFLPCPALPLPADTMNRESLGDRSLSLPVSHVSKPSSRFFIVPPPSSWTSVLLDAYIITTF
jgi:hypothetical protein